MSVQLQDVRTCHIDSRLVGVEQGVPRSVRQAYGILHLGFTLAPIAAGLDKFFNLLTNWEQYLAPIVTRVLPLSPSAFMRTIGAVEIVAGIVVWLKPKFGGYLVAAWLCGIIANLLLIPGYYDVALRDFGLALGALALARLSDVS